MKFVLICFALFGAGLAGFSRKGQQAIVNAHNKVRSDVAYGDYLAKGEVPVGPASNMRKMSWDLRLARSAQAFADTCPIKHVKGKKDYGENLYMAWSSEPIEELDEHGVMASKEFEEEFQKFGWLHEVYDDETHRLGIGHATQMIWSTSSLIGCGVKDCGFDKKDEMYMVSVVCHYKNRGNMEDAKIFKIGEPCSACPSGTYCEEDTGLCV